ncbi:hypothetical protein FEF26_07305 [Nesterenkonia salmonea]|uniref:DUF4037 domain-containing protein n=1 Tax=Nesterenkonia salmonea TaxID=1804987 RepID=A0A5R9BBC5_9MICC|nr:hypothetical protein [Nesterenkonia salmonea]TLP97574.1 hypothetical protein FEF26_07305 [Nesterenkonia salmonea]
MHRRKAAQELADQYVATGNVSAVMLAGSLGRGRNDEFSDVELDVYWTVPPTDDQRRDPTLALQGAVTKLWPYDIEDAEWSENVRICDAEVTVSGFSVAEIDSWIALMDAADEPHLIRQMRMSAIHEGEPLYGEELVTRWRSSATYPGPLAVATATSFLTPERLNRWRLWSALLQRDDLAMLHRACSEATEVILGTLCALNRIYIEHPSFKWSRHLVGRFTRAPVGFSDRLFSALTVGPIQGAPTLHALLEETVELVAADLPKVDISTIESVLNDWRE